MHIFAFVSISRFWQFGTVKSDKYNLYLIVYLQLCLVAQSSSNDYAPDRDLELLVLFEIFAHLI